MERRAAGTRGWLCLLLVMWIEPNDGLQVIGGAVTVVSGSNATLSCRLTETNDRVLQVLWQRSTVVSPPNDNFFNILKKNEEFLIDSSDSRFHFVGNFQERIGSLQLFNVSLMDEGRYNCIFFLLQSGNLKTEVSLNLLVPPIAYLKYETPQLGMVEVLLATCTAAAARPPAQVKWVTNNANFTEKTNSIKHDNSTTTTVCSLFGVPTRDIPGLLIQCVVSSVALEEDQVLPLTLQVFFSPLELTFNETSEDTIYCTAKGYPEPHFTWTRSGQALSSSDVRAEGPELKFLSKTPDIKGLYECEAGNPYGRQSAKILVRVVSGCQPSYMVGWILFGLLLLLNVVAALWFLYRHWIRTKGQRVFQSVPNPGSTHEGGSPDPGDLSLS